VLAGQRRPAEPPIRQIDHVMIKANDPREVFAFFTETLRHRHEPDVPLLDDLGERAQTTARRTPRASPVRVLADGSDVDRKLLMETLTA
jgi:hypothetical protein